MYWDPNPDIFIIPYFDHPVKWYGFFFVIGFFIGYYLSLPYFRKYVSTQNEAQALVDKLLWYVIIGTVAGARLGHVLFYEPYEYLTHPLEILKIWRGGLASHGGTIGVLLGVYFFRRSIKETIPSLTFLKICDIMTAPTALVGCFIRIGNFFNQEILGTPSNLPWAITFGTPFDGSAPIPRHPTQLYEALFCFALFLLLFSLRNRKLAPGRLVGIFFLFLFSSRFLLEFTKMDQGGIVQNTFLQTGQILSVPFIILGIYLLIRKQKLPKTVH